MNDPPRLIPRPAGVKDAGMAAKHVYWIAAVMTLVAGYLCWSGAPLIWDGSYQMCLTLMYDRPYSYLGRFHSALLWQPTVWVSHFTDNLRVLTFIYGLPFCMAPVVGLLASWAVVRRESPGLMLWSAMGILAGPLPGQIFIINDSILQMHLFWPVFVGMLVRLSRWQIALLAGLAVFQFSHPMGIATFFGAAMAAGIMAWADHDGRWIHLLKAGIMLALSLAAALKLGIWPDTYAAQEAGWHEALSRWHNGVAGWPIRGMVMVWIAAGLLLAGRITGRSLLGWIGLASLLIGAGIWIYWAADLHRWAFAIDYRRWLLPLSMPFFACATLECADRKSVV